MRSLLCQRFPSAPAGARGKGRKGRAGAPALRQMGAGTRGRLTLLHRPNSSSGNIAYHRGFRPGSEVPQ